MNAVFLFSGAVSMILAGFAVGSESMASVGVGLVWIGLSVVIK